MNAKLGERIHALRVERDFTQEQVAEYLGMSRQKYARVEKGINDITLDILMKIAELFGVGINDITSVIDTSCVTAYRKSASSEASVDMINEMLDLFYANKHVYERLTYKDEL